MTNILRGPPLIIFFPGTPFGYFFSWNRAPTPTSLSLQLGITSSFPDYGVPAYFCHSNMFCIENHFSLQNMFRVTKISRKTVVWKTGRDPDCINDRHLTCTLNYCISWKISSYPIIGAHQKYAHMGPAFHWSWKFLALQFEIRGSFSNNVPFI